MQDPIRLSERSELQPDLTVLQHRPDFYASGHPGSADVVLAVEVADTTVAWDRNVKVPLYGGGGRIRGLDRRPGGRDGRRPRAPKAQGNVEVRQARRGEVLQVAGTTIGVDDVLG